MILKSIQIIDFIMGNNINGHYLGRDNNVYYSNKNLICRQQGESWHCSWVYEHFDYGRVVYEEWIDGQCPSGHCCQLPEGSESIPLNKPNLIPI